MTDAHGIALKTAKRLAPQFGEALPLTVEKVIHGAGAKPGQFDLGAVAALAGIASFILQCVLAALEWKHKHSGKVDIDALVRALRELQPPQVVNEKACDEIIKAVAEETKAEGEK